MARPIVGITMGDAAGVGPEIIMKALAVDEVHEICRPLVIGDAGRLRKAGDLVRSRLKVNSLRDKFCRSQTSQRWRFDKD